MKMMKRLTILSIFVLVLPHFVQAMTKEELEELKKDQEKVSELFKQQDKQKEEFENSSDRWDSAVKEVSELRRQVSSVLKGIVVRKDINTVEFINKADFEKILKKVEASFEDFRKTIDVSNFMKQEDRNEETTFLKKEFDTAQKNIVNIKLDYVTKVLSILNSWFEGFDKSEAASLSLSLSYWFDDIKKIMIDKIFFKDDSRFLSKKEVDTVSMIVKSKLKRLYVQVSKLFKRIESLENIKEDDKDKLIRILSFNLWYKQPY